MVPEQHTKNLPRILVVDDELPMRRFFHMALSGEDFFLYDEACGRAGLAATLTVRPDLVLLDLGLPDMAGLEFIARLRVWSLVPIIALSERDREDEKVLALNAGADDYLTKPLGAGELVARIRAVLRRSLRQVPEPVFSCNGLMIDFARRRVMVGDKEIHLTPIEYDILRLLATNAGKVLLHHQFMMGIWGCVKPKHAHVLRMNISNLRHKIEPDPSHPQHIITETGIGYRLKN